MLSGKHEEASMARIKVRGTVLVVERDGTWRRLARVSTDAVKPNGQIPDEDEFKDACDKAIVATKGMTDIDGIQLDPCAEGL
jgi:hypothetical protein